MKGSIGQWITNWVLLSVLFINFNQISAINNAPSNKYLPAECHCECPATIPSVPTTTTRPTTTRTTRTTTTTTPRPTTTPLLETTTFQTGLEAIPTLPSVVYLPAETTTVPEEPTTTTVPQTTTTTRTTRTTRPTTTTTKTTKPATRIPPPPPPIDYLPAKPSTLYLPPIEDNTISIDALVPPPKPEILKQNTGQFPPIKFKGPTYLPPSRTTRVRTTTTFVPQKQRSFSSFSLPRYTFRYTYPTFIPTRTPSRSRPTYTVSTTEGYPFREEDNDIKSQLLF